MGMWSFEAAEADVGLEGEVEEGVADEVVVVGLSPHTVRLLS